MKKLIRGSLAAAILLATFTAPAFAGETSTGNLYLYRTKLKSVGAQGEVVALPTCPDEIEVFSDTLIGCWSRYPWCAIEATMSSELSDVSGTRDSVRFKLYIDGRGVAPSSNAGVQSTAKAGQIESSTMTWFQKRLGPGTHRVEARMCVADSDGGGASAFAGDRTLTVRSYKGS